MTVSVVVLHFGDRRVTRECLTRLADCEVVLVDNQPTKWTAGLYGHADTVIRNRDNKGFAYGANQGAALSTGNPIVFLNNDTQPLDGWLDHLVPAVQRSASGIAGAKLVYRNTEIQHAGVRMFVDNGVLTAENIGRGEGDRGQYDKPKHVDAVTGACMAVERATFFELGGFDTHFWNGYEDVDLCLRAGGAFYEPRSVVVHDESVSGPERWSRVRENVELLNARWLGKFTDAD